MASAKNYGLIFILLITSLMSCKDDDSSGSFGEGSGIKGKINVQNEFQQPLYSERSGIKVLLETGYRQFVVMADNVGNWQLADAPAGTYKITYSKAGYSTVVDRDIVLSYTSPKYQVDNKFQKLPSATITKLPLTDFNNLELVLNSTPVGQDTVYMLNISAVMLPAPPPTGHAKGYRIFIGKDSEVSPSNYIFQKYYSTTTAAISQTFNNEWFNTLNIHSGDEIYAAIYGDASFNMEPENDEGDLTFPNLSELPGAVGSVVLP